MRIAISGATGFIGSNLRVRLAELGHQDLVLLPHQATPAQLHELLKGVRYTSQGASTQSLVMRSKSGTVRLVEAQHKLEKLQEYSSIEFS